MSKAESVPGFALDAVMTAAQGAHVLVLVDDRSTIRDRMDEVRRALTPSDDARVTMRNGGEAIRLHGRGQILFRTERDRKEYLRGIRLGLVVAPFEYMSGAGIVRDLVPLLGLDGRISFAGYRS